MSHLMIDLETLGIRNDAPVLAIGAVYFNPFTGEIGKEFYAKISYKKPITIDYATFEWWMQQETAARMALFDNAKSLRQALINFNAFHTSMIYRVWSHGSVFDIPIIEKLLVDGGYSVPWGFRDIRDTRTIFELAGVVPEHQGPKHNALVDAIAQAHAVCQAYRKLGIKE